MTIANRMHPDTLIALKAAADAATAAYDAAKEQFVADYDLGTHEGSEKNVSITLSQRSVIDYDKLLADYGITKEQFDLFSACKKDGKEFTVVKVVAKKKEAA